MRDGALLLGVGLGAEDDVRGLGRGVLEVRDREHGARAAQRLGPAGTVGEVADRIRVDEDEAVELAVEEPLLDLLEPAAVIGAGEAGAEAGQRAGLAGAPRVRALRDRQHAAALRAAVERLGDLDERVEGRAPGAAAADALAPDHQRLARAQLAGDAFCIANNSRHVLGFACGPVGRGPLAELRRQLVEERGRLAGQVAGGFLGAAVERGRAVGRDHQPGARMANRLAQPQVEDRHRVEGVGADQQDRLGVVDRGDRGAQSRG